ncbi:hypothetical protein OESDEN_09536 [Oesophagostomum dentatum]|uniref:Uncharacterized protein n=1 Tax=Oesophagostomum dentatum TaxID=61180 RepID=A0A0B1T3B7_OESDE|nr:hypothetical protein OESDEN_09536 [Oesophagostomum dentatum]
MSSFCKLSDTSLSECMELLECFAYELDNQVQPKSQGDTFVKNKQKFGSENKQNFLSRDNRRRIDKQDDAPFIAMVILLLVAHIALIIIVVAIHQSKFKDAPEDSDHSVHQFYHRGTKLGSRIREDMVEGGKVPGLAKV